MKLRSKKCNCCGAKLVYNNTTYKYDCEYCGASYETEKGNGELDPRVELTPDDLKKVEKRMQTATNQTNAFVKLFTIIFFVIFLLSIVSFFIIFTINTRMMF